MKSDKSQNNLFLKYMDFSINSSQNQSEYMNVMVNVCSTMLNLLKHENLIIDLNYNPSEFWPKAKNKTVAFVDGVILSPSHAIINLLVSGFHL